MQYSNIFDILKVLFPKKAFINGSSDYERDFGSFVKRSFSTVPLTDTKFRGFDWNFDHSDQSARSVKVTQVTIQVLEAVYPVKTLVKKKKQNFILYPQSIHIKFQYSYSKKPLHRNSFM